MSGRYDLGAYIQHDKHHIALASCVCWVAVHAPDKWCSIFSGAVDKLQTALTDAVHVALQGSEAPQGSLTSTMPLIQLGSQPIEDAPGTGENATLRRAFTTASMILQQSQDAPGLSQCPNICCNTLHVQSCSGCVSWTLPFMQCLPAVDAHCSSLHP